MGGRSGWPGKRLAVALSVSAALLVAVPSASAQGVQLVPFGGQTFSSPFFVAADPGDADRVFVVEGTGTIRLVEDGETKPTPFLTIPEVFTGCNACGLFSMALAPDFASTGAFYVFYTRDSAVEGENFYLRIEEFRRSPGDPDVADPSSRRIVLEIPHLETVIHSGGQLQFGPDGFLYISVGDGGPQGDPNGNAQNLQSVLGKLLRIDPAGTIPGEYSIPPGNPFAGTTPGANEIYSYGLRNPWRFSFDRLTGDLTIGDVGHASWEEIDFVPRGGGSGANFGWNCFEGTQPYPGAPPTCMPPPENIPPVLEYQNPAPGTAAVTGGYVIRDGALPSLLGRYVYADSSGAFGGELRTAQLFPGGSSGDSGLQVNASSVVSFGEDACAHIYVAELGGTVYRLEPASGPFPCAPQTLSNPPPGPSDTPGPEGSSDRLGPRLLVGLKLARRAAKRGAVILRLTCDEGCTATGEGTIKIRRKSGRGPRRLLLDGTARALEPGEPGRLVLDLPRRGRRVLLLALRNADVAIASIRLTATDGAGNVSTVARNVRQKR